MEDINKVNKRSLSLSDELAVARTNLANERTFLAYFRTSIVLFSSGIAIVRLDFFEKMYDFGLILTLISPIIILIGTLRFWRFKKKIEKMYSV